MAADLTAQQLAELRAIDSPTIANAIEYFTVRAACRRLLRDGRALPDAQRGDACSATP